MICPICKKEHTNFFAHVYTHEDNDHILFLKDIQKEVHKLAPANYSFGIAETLVTRDTYQFLKEDMYTLTAFISELIVAIGYSRRRRVNSVRDLPYKRLVNTDTLLRCCSLALPSSVRKTLPLHVKVPDNCMCCNARTSLITVSVDPRSMCSLLSDTMYVCNSCMLERKELPIMSVTKIFTFAAAHHLPGHPKLCQYTHGHEWQLEVTVKAVLNPETRMVIDFSDLKKYVNVNIIDVLDHNYINDLLWNPTAENICAWIWDKLMYAGLIGIEKIKLWEAPESFATLTKEDYDI